MGTQLNLREEERDRRNKHDLCVGSEVHSLPLSIGLQQAVPFPQPISLPDGCTAPATLG